MSSMSELRILGLEQELEKTKKNLEDLLDLVRLLIKNQKDNLNEIGNHYLAADLIHGN